ncbi:MAG: alcohol dehydrogenase [Thaumarchaeota archaeon]|nr:alcohol dehydrogenase [Nitrososphaerota archaeon]
MRLESYGAPLRLEEIERPETGRGVLVRVEAAGVCHTDIHIVSGSYDLGDGNLLRMAERGIQLPITPGHEMAGRLADLGGFTEASLREGDPVVVYPWLGCGTCRKCTAGYENLCEGKPASLGIFRDGGYAEYVWVPHPRYLVPRGNLEVARSAPLACSGLTSFSALKKCALNGDDLLVIVGAGGLGTIAVQLAKRTTGAKVLVLDVSPSKLELASELGADQTIDTSGRARRDVISEIKQANGGRGADAVLDFVGNPSTSTMGFEMLTKQGRLVLVGLFGGAASFPLPLFPLRGAQILGSFTGTLTELSELVGVAATGAVTTFVSAEYPLEDANDVLRRLERGEVMGRAVLRP